MRLQENIDFTTLQWVKPELDETLARAREALEAYVGRPTVAEPMRDCAERLHQVQSILRMVELYGAALVTEEMESLALALLAGGVDRRDDAYAALMRGLVQLPDYLERLSSGHRDVPMVLLPLLNELRAARNQQALSEAALFMPNLEAPLPSQVPGAADAGEAERHLGEIAELRVRFQQHLLAWFRNQQPAQRLAGMRQALLGISARCWSVPGRRVWWIAAAVLEGLEQGLLKSQAGEIRRLIGRVDRNIRQLLDRGEESLRGGDADDLARQLLYLVAQARQRSPQMELLRQVYRLDSLLPDAAELEHARGSMSGHNRALLDSVAKALKEDLLRVKDALDLFLRQPDADPATLGVQCEVLERVGDTLGMLALGVPRRVIGEQRRVLAEIVRRARPADEETLLDMAGALLYVEASLDDHIDSLGADEDSADEAGPLLPRSEARHILATLMQEAVGNTAKVKDAIVAFVESGWRHDALNSVPVLMDEVAGALRMLSAMRPADLAEGIGRFVRNELLVEQRVPSAAQMDHLADALAALEYYLEAAREHRGGLDHILDVAEHSLGELGYWPLPQARALLEATAAPAPAARTEPPPVPVLDEPVSLAPGDAPETLFFGEARMPAEAGQDLSGLRLVQTEEGMTPPAADQDWTEIEETIVEERPVADPLAAQAGFERGGEDIDDEIRTIFLEEVSEEIGHLEAAESAWRMAPEQQALLVPIRRSFHTLKGSGRLVGARVLGEFAWKIENMLNRVLDGTIPPHDDVVALVRHAIAALPQLRRALADGTPPEAPLSAIMQVADRLATGERATVEQVVAAAGTEAVRRTVRRRLPAVDADAAPAALFNDAGLAGVPAQPAQPAPEETIPLPAMPPVDPVLLEILRSEVAQYLQTIRAALADAGQAIPVEDDLLRAVHTLHGAIAMVDVEPLMRLLSPLEGLIKRLRGAGTPLSAEAAELVSSAADLVEQYMREFDAAEPQLPDVEPLAARLAALRDAQHESPAPIVSLEPPIEFAGAFPDLVDHDARVEQTAEPARPPDVEPVRETADEQKSPSSAAGDADEASFALDEALIAALDAFEPPIREPLETPHDEQELDALLDALLEERPAPTDAAEAQADTGEALEESADMTAMADDAAAEAPDVEPEPSFVASFDAAAHAVDTGLAEHAETPQERTPQPAAPDEVQAAAAPEHDELAAIADVSQAPAASLAPEVPETSEAQETQEAQETTEVSAAPTGPVDQAVDQDLLEVFLDEARDLLDHADATLAQWRAAPEEMAPVKDLQRDLHTLKGGARIAGLAPVGDLAHAIETLLEKPIAEPSRAVEVIRLLEHGFDHLHGLTEALAQGRAMAYPQALIDRVLALAGASAASTPVEQAAVEPLPALLPEETTAEDGPNRGGAEQIRVRADLLDSLVNHAGEVAIYRSRLEQQVSAYRFNLAELEQTVTRLRSQLRMLEIETEAQIIARYQREHREAGMAAFDPLELDRFSQLQQYSRALAESVSDLVSIQGTLDELTRQAETLLIQQSRVSSDLQEGLLRTRMLPFDTLVPNLRRTLRQSALEEGKLARLVVEGAHGEMDRNLLDRLKAPFEHMLRNAVAHGIESPADRRRAGKPEEGTVRIQVAREATEVVVRISDDGRGLDRAAIRARALERGLIEADATLDDARLLALIVQPGFSTAGTVTQLAGRGVGMDVVANEIRQLGGSLAIESAPGEGTTFVLRLPFTLAVTQAILVRIGEASFAIPMASVQGVARVAADELAAHLASDTPVFEHHGEAYGIHDLGELLDLPARLPSGDETVPLLLTRAGDVRAAIRIDAVIGSREIVVKSVGPQVSSVPGVLGATIMGDGSVLVILDLPPLIRHNLTRRARRVAEGRPAVPAPVAAAPRQRPLVMVVDDSITMRKVTSRVLERHEYEVATAKDGLDALEKLHESRVPDLMLLDIEMPRMDGYELATQMKADPRLREVPIIMITSRTGEKHRQRAFDIGVDHYLGKPYQESELLALIGEMLQPLMETPHG
ncbi:MAG: Hpt domain-containing protein [Fulvimonas sp.]|nr:Hpt domain-containing protein [Fulvimonas sp.]